jgi:response regulator RpfG family c-di-GMP phosphodiesterase
MLSTKILCVDDEANVLAGYTRQLRKDFDIATALGGDEAIKALENDGPFAVIVSDMRMPGISGIEVLARARQIAPDCVRMMLTGNQDQQTAVGAVNDAQIYRFLNKPCSAATLTDAIRSALEQHRLLHAEKELLEDTLQGCVKVLAEVLSLAHPSAFGRAVRVQHVARKLGEALNAPNRWQLEIAALLCQIGSISVPDAVLAKLQNGEALNEHERVMVERQPQLGATLIAKIPRLGPVAEAISWQAKRYDGQGSPPGDVKGAAIPLSARILKAALDFDALQSRGQVKADSVQAMVARTGWYDPAVLVALASVVRGEARAERKLVRLDQIKPGMVLDENVVNASDAVLIDKGQEVSPALLARLLNLGKTHAIKQPIAVRMDEKLTANLESAS